jgi:hypothetical protein
MAKKAAKPRPQKARYYIRIQDEFVDLRTNPKPGHSYVWLIERDGAASEGRMHGCMLTQSALRLCEWLESLGVEVQRVHMPADQGLCISDKSDPDCMPELKANETAKNLPPDVAYGKIDAVQPAETGGSPGDVGDLLNGIL